MSPDHYHLSFSYHDDDRFYSLPSSQAATRHASTRAASRRPSGSTAADSQLLSLQSALNSAKLSVENNDSYSHFFSRDGLSKAVSMMPTIERLSKEGPLVSNGGLKRGGNVPGADHTLSEELINTEKLVSSPAPPVTTKCWSSISIGNRSSSCAMRGTRAASLDASYVDNPVAARRAIESIVANIRAYLSDRRHDRCCFRAGRLGENRPTPQVAGARPECDDEAQSPDDEEIDNYLVSTNDIAGILDIVIAGLRCLHEGRVPTGSLSVFLRKDPNARFSTSSGKIIPPASSVADPATTISSVDPLFSLDGRHKSAGPSDKCIKATIISRQSVTEVS